MKQAKPEAKQHWISTMLFIAFFQPPISRFPLWKTYRSTLVKNYSCMQFSMFQSISVSPSKANVFLIRYNAGYLKWAVKKRDISIYHTCFFFKSLQFHNISVINIYTTFKLYGTSIYKRLMSGVNGMKKRSIKSDVRIYLSLSFFYCVGNCILV